MTGQKLLATGISVSYGSLEVLHNLSFHCVSGEVVLVIGHNGAGKTTLLRCLAGLMLPRCGAVAVEGHSIQKMAVAFLTQKANVFQNKSVLRNLSVGHAGRFKARNPYSRNEEIAFLERNFPDLLGRLDTKVATLSGGQQQMTALARTMLMPAAFLLLDEPTLGLNEQQIRRVLPTIRAAAIQSMQGVVIVEHKIEAAIPYADRVVVLKRGNIVLNRSASTITGLKDIREYYF